MKKVYLIGQFPPPIHGLSKALDTILKSDYLNEKYEIENLDITNNKKIFSYLKSINNSYADIYYFTISQSKMGNIRDMLILNKLLKKNKKVIIHYHGGYYKSLYNSLNFFQKRLNKKLISQVSLVIVLSEGLKSIFSNVISVDKIRVCENFIEDSSLLSDKRFTQKINNYHKKNDTLNVLFLSNFIESKGYKDILEAICILKKTNYKMKFHFAGAFFSLEEENNFHSYIKEHDIEEYIIYHNIVEKEQKRDLLYKCEIFILPTYYKKEGQPISIIEAMGNGLAIITTRHAGIPDIVSESNGALIYPQSPNEIVQSLINLSDKNSLIDIAKNNRDYTLTKFKEVHYIERLDKIFNEVLTNESGIKKI
ncbi:glycosyltransferase family 4 protein [Niallia sp. HCP3S3_B10]|uniref:glycosyltransferase family 4 protein n=1 Tax=Niallia sp. HCP3S3_B10 TaxID=3438944 RepID=UPI003F8C3463